MKNVLTLGASGGLAGYVIDELQKKNDIHLTLFLRNKKRLNTGPAANCTIIEGDVLDYNKLKDAIAGQDIVYVNLAGNLEAMSQNIVKVMKETGVKRIIAISSIGIYNTPLRSVLIPYRKLADVIEDSRLEYTILRPTWVTSANEEVFELTRKDEPENGSVISQKVLLHLLQKSLRNPENKFGKIRELTNQIPERLNSGKERIPKPLASFGIFILRLL